MRAVSRLAVGAVGALAAVGFLAGCGEGDPNKDLKPVDKNAPKPTGAGAGPKQPGAAAPGAVK